MLLRTAPWRPRPVSCCSSQGQLAIVQAILTNMPTRSHSSSSARAAKPESFDGSRDKAEQFNQSVCIAVTIQLNMFVDKRMKILYTLSFMHRGIVQVLAEMRPMQSCHTPPHSPPSQNYWQALRKPSETQIGKGWHAFNYTP